MRFRDDLPLRWRVADEAARAAGIVHMRHRGSRLDRTVHHGDRTDFATRVDFEAQAVVREVVQQYFPHERVIGEEDEDWGDIEEYVEAGCWFTDPLDGTQDYAHGSPAFSCIVSFVEHAEPQAAAVWFPAWQEMYTAAANMGASLNGQPIHVSAVSRLEESICSTAYRGSDPARAEAFARRIAKLLPCVESLRLPGAPGVMACAVAAGRYDLFANVGVLLEAPPSRPFPGQPWESAAFILLVKEAGGAVATLAGGPPQLLGYNVYAANQELIDAYLAVVAEG